MIVNSLDEMSFLSIKAAELLPVSKIRGEGLLAVGERRYFVKVIDDDKNPRAWVVVRLRRRTAGDRVAIGREIARRAMADARWEPLAIDPRDGEITYTVTLTCDRSPEAMDRFLETARSFLRDNEEEIEKVVGDSEKAPAVDGDGDSAGLSDAVVGMLDRLFGE